MHTDEKGQFLSVRTRCICVAIREWNDIISPFQNSKYHESVAFGNIGARPWIRSILCGLDLGKYAKDITYKSASTFSQLLAKTASIAQICSFLELKPGMCSAWIVVNNFYRC